MSQAVKAPPWRVPPGARVVVYACLSPGAAAPKAQPQRALRHVLRYVKTRGCTVAATYVDRAAVLSSRADRPEWPKVLATIEDGRADGIVAPSMETLWFHPEEHDSFMGWLEKTGAFVSTPDSLADLRRPRRDGSSPENTAAPKDTAVGPRPAAGSKRRPR
ncbi:recombinase family protein [Streptomyces sp. LMG1-1-1.1]|uniref:recombinase family protein n=1 Tax=Streptomyces sp. LMG1-1-1.1 TaxID=3135245 RepID=UPI0034666C21